MVPDNRDMSARTQLLEELARAPEGVAGELLTYLRGLMLSKKGASEPTKDFFESYWSRHYGSMEGVEWNEPAELPFETREAW